MAEAPPQKQPLSQRFKQMLEEYGKLALIIYFVIFGLTMIGSAVLISAGVELEGVSGGAGLVAGAWVATKLTQPIRILITLALTPLVAKLWHGWKKRAEN